MTANTVVCAAPPYTGRMRRPHRPASVALAATLAAVLVACAPAAVVVPDDAVFPAHDAALAAPGPRAATVTEGSLISVVGCTVTYEVHEPAVAAAETAVVWTHGFLRDLASMRGWAALAASHGLRSGVVSTCASTPFAGRHDRNAADLRAVAGAAFGPEVPVVYAGFSAGGLAALLAATDDPRAAGVLGLDAVDSGDLAATAIDLAVPGRFLAGSPSSCNADGNLLPVVERLRDVRVARFAYATHGDFELPYDPQVDALCGAVTPQEAREALRAAIRGVALGWLLELAGAPRP